MWPDSTCDAAASVCRPCSHHYLGCMTLHVLPAPKAVGAGSATLSIFDPHAPIHGTHQEPCLLGEVGAIDGRMIILDAKGGLSLSQNSSDYTPGFYLSCHHAFPCRAGAASKQGSWWDLWTGACPSWMQRTGLSWAPPRRTASTACRPPGTARAPALSLRPGTSLCAYMSGQQVSAIPHMPCSCKHDGVFRASIVLSCCSVESCNTHAQFRVQSVLPTYCSKIVPLSSCPAILVTSAD